MRYCPILFCFPFREDDLVDKEEDYHRNAAVEHRGSDVIDKVRYQQARNRRPHAVDGVDDAGDQTDCQHQAICLARSTLPRNTKLRWIRYRIFIQSRENGRVRAQNGSCNLACLDHASNVHQQLRFMAGSLGHKSSSDAVFYASDELFSVAFPFKPPWSFADTPMLPIQRAERS